jgi:hypothetical protein
MLEDDGSNHPLRFAVRTTDYRSEVLEYSRLGLLSSILIGIKFC